jgi:hypothetical protein
MCCCGAHIPSGDVSRTSPSVGGREFQAQGLVPRYPLALVYARPTTVQQPPTKRRPLLLPPTLHSYNYGEERSPQPPLTHQRRDEAVVKPYSLSPSFLSIPFLCASHPFVRPRRAQPPTGAPSHTLRPRRLWTNVVCFTCPQPNLLGGALCHGLLPPPIS